MWDVPHPKTYDYVSKSKEHVAMKRENDNKAPIALDKVEGFSVLLSVYFREKPEYFLTSLESIFNQTLMPSEVILMCDGPLTEPLNAIIADFEHRFPSLLRVIRLPQNEGLGKALNEGLKHCNYSLVARMDSDDYALPQRFEKQISFMYRNPEVDVLSCTISEFETDINETLCDRQLPECHNELLRYAKLRTPANHPSVVFRKEAVLAAGGYKHFHLFEDYYLWVRMMMNGAIFHSLPESLLRFRMNKETLARRKGRNYIKSELKLQKQFLALGFINYGEYLRNILLRVTPRLLPRRLMLLVYKTLLRKRSAQCKKV